MKCSFSCWPAGCISSVHCDAPVKQAGRQQGGQRHCRRPAFPAYLTIAVLAQLPSRRGTFAVPCAACKLAPGARYLCSLLQLARAARPHAAAFLNLELEPSSLKGSDPNDQPLPRTRSTAPSPAPPVALPRATTAVISRFRPPQSCCVPLGARHATEPLARSQSVASESLVSSRFTTVATRQPSQSLLQPSSSSFHADLKRTPCPARHPIATAKSLSKTASGATRMSR